MERRYMALSMTAGFGLATALSAFTGTTPYFSATMTLLAACVYAILTVRAINRKARESA